MDAKKRPAENTNDGAQNKVQKAQVSSKSKQALMVTGVGIFCWNVSVPCTMVVSIWPIRLQHGCLSRHLWGYEIYMIFTWSYVIMPTRHFLNESVIVLFNHKYLIFAVEMYEWQEQQKYTILFVMSIAAVSVDVI